VDALRGVLIHFNQFDPRYGPLVLFVAATGLRPGEWIALKHRDIDRETRVVHVCRAFCNGRIKTTKTLRSTRTVPLQEIAATAIEQRRASNPDALVFPAPEGGHFDLHNFRNRNWQPAQLDAGTAPARLVYGLTQGLRPSRRGECGGRLAANDGRSLTDEFVIRERIDHERGEVDAASEVACQGVADVPGRGVTKIARPGGRATAGQSTHDLAKNDGDRSGVRRVRGVERDQRFDGRSRARPAQRPN